VQFFNGCLLFDIDLANGVKFLGNVTLYYNCLYLSPSSMVVKGDLFTVNGGSVKRTSNIGTLEDVAWETNFC
jgi:hypothetical protein